MLCSSQYLRIPEFRNVFSLVFCCLKLCHQKESMKHWPLCQQLLHPFRVQLPESPVIPRGGGTLLLVFGEQTDCKMCAYLDFWVAFVVSQFSAIIVSICFLKRGLGEVRPPLSYLHAVVLESEKLTGAHIFN